MKGLSTSRRILLAVIMTLLLASSLGRLAAPATAADSEAPTVAPQAPTAAPEFLKNHPDLFGLIAEDDTFVTGGGYLYWARCQNGPNVSPTGGAGYLRRWPLNGGRVVTMVNGDFCDTRSWAADDAGLYYTAAAHEGNLYIFRRPVSDPTTAHYVMRVDNNVTTRLILDETYVYWAGSVSDIFRADKDLYFDPTDPRYEDYERVVQTTGAVREQILTEDGTLIWFAGNTLQSAPKSCNDTCTATTLGTDSGRHLTDATFYGYLFGSTWHPLWVSGSNIRGRWCGTFSCSIETLYAAPNINGNQYRPGRLATDEEGTYLFWIENYDICTPPFGCSPSNEAQLMRWPLVQLVPPFPDPEPIAAHNSGAQYIVDRFDQELEVAAGWVYFHTSEGPARVRVDAPPVQADIEVTGWEVTQGIQNPGAATGGMDVALVADKTTYVRVYGRRLSGPRMNNVTAELNLLRNAVVITLRPVPGFGSVSFPTAGGVDQSNRAAFNDSWLFQIPHGWTFPATVNFRVTLNPERRSLEPNSVNNRMERDFTFTDKAPICVVFVPVRTSAGVAVDSPEMWFAHQMAEMLLPTHDIPTWRHSNDVAELQARFGIPPWEYGPYEIEDDSSKVLQSLWARDQFSDDPDICDNFDIRTHYVGVVHQNAGGNNGSAWGGHDNMWFRVPDPGSIWSSNRAPTFAHELAHNYDRDHINCPEGDPDDPDGGYPFPACDLDYDDGSDRHYGFLIDPATGTPRVILPTTAGDLLSYAHRLPTAKPRWPSSYTWNGIFNELANGPMSSITRPAPGLARAPDVPDLAGAEEVVLLTGMIHLSDSTQSVLNPAYVIPTDSVSERMVEKWQRYATAPYRPARTPLAPFHLRLLDAEEAILADVEVVLMDEADESGPFQAFTAVFPAPSEEVTRIELLDGETVLASQEVGVNPPVVTIIEPGGGETIEDELTLVWTATDDDTDDRLSFSVQYSPDNGQSWIAMLTEIPNTSGTDTMTVELQDVAALPGSTTGALVRVLASDGYHTTLATSQPFTVAQRAPEPRILAPSPMASVPAGQSVILQGAASDAEEGSLPENSLLWRVEGAMTMPFNASGADTVVPGLAPGRYDVTLSAADMEGNEATRSSTFTVAPLALPAMGAPALDGFCEDDAYVSATRLQLPPYIDGSEATVLLGRTDSHLWACFSNLRRVPDTPSSAVLRADPNNSRDTTPQADDYEFRLTDDGTPSTLSGNGSVFGAGGPGGLDGRVSADGLNWNAEMRVDAAVLGGWGRAIGIQVGHLPITPQGDEAYWPYRSAATSPSTWATTALGALPQITGISPLAATVNDPAFTLTITGTNFVEGSLIQWNGEVLAPSVASPTQLTATVPAAHLGAAGTVPVQVVNPGLEATPSNAVLFTVYNPTPIITHATLAGNAVTVEGSGFVAGAMLLWDGIEQPAVVSSGGRLVATINPTLIPAGGPVTLTVMNPAPTQGPSNEWQLMIDEVVPGDNQLFLPMLLGEGAS